MIDTLAVGDRLIWRDLVMEVVDVAPMAGWCQVVLSVVGRPRRPPLSVPLSDLADADRVVPTSVPLCVQRTPPAVVDLRQPT